ncbi:MAG TPA: hypothetical protein VFS23_40820 [Vicinamibacterales bacterium]|nr:hypothetical protein [Vicinamibacterales bacterium]
MRPFHFRSLAVAAGALLALAGIAAAQDKPSGLLNSLEVRQLVERAEPVDNARLGAHFSALADRYAAEAKRHISMSQSFVGNPSRNLGTGMSAHCKRLADLNTQSATTVRELAAYHQKLASGTPATPPKDGARFQGGAGAPEPTSKELDALAAKANTPAEHRALEEYFLTLAKRYSNDANEHVTLAQTYRGTRIAQAAAHHERLAGLSRDAAKEATAAAEMHKGLAGVAR